MRTILSTLSLFIAVSFQIFAQVPQGINYQAIVRNEAGQVITNQNVSFRLSVRQNEVSGTIQYQEEHNTTTNAHGLINLQIGNGNVLSGTFNDITWADGLPKYLQIELDPNGGTNYINMGVQQLTSVPYAMVAGSVLGGGSGWNLDGNANTDPASHFIGTTDAQPLQFRVNNLPAGLLSDLNTAWGVNALPNITSGVFNEAVGTNALINNTSGNNNVSIGTNSLYNNNANHNTAIGRSALQANTSGNSNTAIGVHALFQNTERSNLVAVGDSALFHNGTNATELFHGAANTALGSKSLFYNTIGRDNTAIGYMSLHNNTSGYANTANGVLSLFNNTTGIDNTSTGYQSLALNTTGVYNSATGSGALRENTTGNYNTANGFQALFSNTTGEFNTAIGTNALLYSTTGRGNTAGGFGALWENTTGNNNSAFGRGALVSNTTGYSNVAIGVSTLSRSVNRSNNVAVGDSTLYNNGFGVASNATFEGTQNTAVGSKALLNNTTGWQNTAFGYHALYNNVTGTGNTAMGIAALYANTNGAGNVAIGFGALGANTSGQLNVAIGDDALYGNSTGFYNTGVGVSSGGNVAGLNNSVAVGYASFPNNSNVALLGNTTTTCGGFSNWNNWSDGRFKINVQENVVGLAFINVLRPITYTADMHKLNAFIYGDKAQEYETNLKEIIQQRAGEIQSGFIAQEVEAAAQQTGYVFNGVIAPDNPDNQYYTLSYAAFVVPLVKAVQELNQMIETQNTTISHLQQKTEKMEAELQQIRAMLTGTKN
ncbi:MAG: tail fiber domain-containing protein [Sphingobacteriales bacterium]|nr:MAG: tail fiber domain-containing protein [Sphingobacteriales bacterium]